MAKKIVTKTAYHACNLSFYSLCLSGLIWQVTQISVNFFKFDVLKDINVVMPEEVNDTDTVLYVCFDNSEILSYKKYLNILNVTAKNKRLFGKKLDYPADKTNRIVSMNINQRFIITLESNTMFDIVYRESVEEFIIGIKYCYMLPKTEKHVISKSHLVNVTLAYVSLGQRLPLFDYRRLQTIGGFQSINHTHDIDIASYTFSIERLAWPYIENCVDYNKNNLTNRLRIITLCTNLAIMNDSIKLYEKNIVRRRKLKYLYYHIAYETKYRNAKEYERQCYKQYQNFDCIQLVFFTKVTAPKESIDLRGGQLILRKGDSNDASFIIKSKARIDNIDYVTYILGALGFWLGFSFIGINPIPHILSVNGQEQDGGQKDSDIKVQNRMLYIKMNILMKKMEDEKQKNEHSQELLQQKIFAMESKLEKYQDLERTMNTRLNEIEVSLVRKRDRILTK